MICISAGFIFLTTTSLLSVAVTVEFQKTEQHGQLNLHNMAVVPFEAYQYVMRDDDILNVTEHHRTCNTTIMVRRLYDWNDQPFTEYHDDNSELQIEGNKNLVCISVGSKVGAMVAVSSSYSNRNLDDEDVSFLESNATELVVQELEHALQKSRIDLEMEIVPRKIIAVGRNWYEPMSNEAINERRKDGNTGNFLWKYGSTRMINPYTTEFIPAVINQYTAEFVPAISNKVEEEASALVLADANTFYMYKAERKRYSKRKDKVVRAEKERYSRGKDKVVGLTNMVRKVDKPTILLGIGVEVPFEDFKYFQDTDTLKLHEHQATLLNEIKTTNQATTSVSVRGNVTQTIAMNAGVTNTISLGCPR